MSKSKLKTRLRYRKRTEFTSSKGVKYKRYVLVCGMIVFRRLESEQTGPELIITEQEYPTEFGELTTEYTDLVIKEPLSKQDVTFE